MWDITSFGLYLYSTNITLIVAPGITLSFYHGSNIKQLMCSSYESTSTEIYPTKKTFKTSKD